MQCLGETQKVYLDVAKASQEVSRISQVLDREISTAIEGQSISYVCIAQDLTNPLL